MVHVLWISIVLAVVAQILVWTSNVKIRGLYNRYRELDHMGRDEAPKKQKRFWGWIGYVCLYARLAFPLIGVLSFLGSMRWSH